jgi:hypothetical protein
MTHPAAGADVELTRPRACERHLYNDPLPGGGWRRCGQPAVRVALYVGDRCCTPHSLSVMYECGVHAAQTGEVCQHERSVDVVVLDLSPRSP